MDRFCPRCDRSFVSHEALLQHLANSTAHNRRTQRRHQRRSVGTPPARSANSPRSQQDAYTQQQQHQYQHQHQQPEASQWMRNDQARTRWYPKYERTEDGRWCIGLARVPLTGSLQHDNNWCCVLCNRNFQTPRSLSQHMTDASHHLSILDRGSDWPITLERRWRQRVLAPLSGPRQPRDNVDSPLVPPSPPQLYRDSSVDRWDSWEQREGFLSDFNFHGWFEEEWQVEEEEDWESELSSPELIIYREAESLEFQLGLDGIDAFAGRDRSNSTHANPVNRAPTPDSLPSLEEIDDIEEDLPLQEQVSQLREKMAGLKTQLHQLKQDLKEEKAARQCSMCYERENDTITECGHQFCNRCVTRWQRQQRLVSLNLAPCPLCRAPMGTPIKVYAARG